MKRLPAARRAALLRKLLLYGGGLALVVLVLTGRLNPLLALIGGAVPLAYRALGALNALHSLKQASQQRQTPGSRGRGRRSVVRSRFLEMSLDHETGEVRGAVVAGPRQGESLSEMALSALIALHQHYAETDPQSCALLEAFMDQQHAGWRASASHRGGAGQVPESTGMSEEEAREILGVSPGATNQEIREAHRRLMQRLHPDRGGSTYLAAKVNQAKRILERGNG